MQTDLLLNNLRCEYMKDPRGILCPNPRLSWEIRSSRRGIRQGAYRILVSGSKDNLDAGIGDMWDSGIISGDESVQVEYAGRRLDSGGLYYWKAMVWDGGGFQSPFSDTAFFQMGLSSAEDWGAEWIGAPPDVVKGAPLFRRTLEIKGEVASATAFISGLGYCEFYVNGAKIGDSVLDPGWTDYGKSVLYSIYDVRDALTEGTNTLSVILGKGWYCTPQWNGTPKFILKLVVDYCDGTRQTVTTGKASGWETASSPIIEDSIYNGEHYDARMAKPYSDLDWIDAITVEAPSGRLTPQIMEPIKVVGELTPLSMTAPKPEVYVYDMGQNMAGWVRLTIEGCKGLGGTAVALKFAETLYDDGTVNQENLRSAQAKDVYILNGDACQTYEPRFTYHGFRYVQVEGYPGIPSLNSVTGRVVRSGVEPIGSFQCSDSMLNRLHKNVVRTEAGNLHSVPTDCPQRDERMGWLNDMTVRFEEAMYNFRMVGFYRKWIDDIGNTQDGQTGAIADTAPFVWGNRPADPVCSCYLLIPWFLYVHFGDVRTLREHYEGMKAWTNFLASQAQDGIVDYSHWGDWASPVSECEGMNGAVSKFTPGALMSTGYLYYNAVVMSKMAGVLGRHDDEEAFGELAQSTKSAFNAKFYDKIKGLYASGSQGSNTFPLFLDLVPEEDRQKVLASLVEDIAVHGNHLTTGNLCTKYIMEVLTEQGYPQAAYDLAEQTSYPSWGYMLSKGATTIWERWEYATGEAMNSHNHPMYGTIGSWFYKYIAGIKPCEDRPGFGKVLIRPRLAGQLSWAEASLKTVRGTVTVSWYVSDEGFIQNLTIPPNSEAEAFIPLADLGKDARRCRIFEGDTVVWQDGEFITGAQAVTEGRSYDGGVLFKVGSGEYRFKAVDSK